MTDARRGNLLQPLAVPLAEELFEELVRGSRFKLVRIVSTGQATPPGQWYDQEEDEWVVLLSGAARLRLADRDEIHHMTPGDYVHLPAHCRHRVEWTDPAAESVWLALHYQPEDGS